jgi:hypothetical protein
MKFLIVKGAAVMFYGSISSWRGAKCNRIPVCITKVSRHSPLRQVYELTRYSHAVASWSQLSVVFALGRTRSKVCALIFGSIVRNVREKEYGYESLKADYDPNTEPL